MKNGLIGSKIKEKMYTKCLKTTLGPTIIGTKCDRDKLFFSAERETDCGEAYNREPIR